MKEVAIEILKAHTVFAPKKIEDLREKELVKQMMLRRRLTRNAKIMLYLADKCGYKGENVVYGSAYGELQATVGITNAIAQNTPISPTLFQNSVYNASPSYLSLLHKAKGEMITISSGNNTSFATLQTAALQSLVTSKPVFCVATECFDIERIEELNSCSSYLEAGVGAMIVATTKTDNGKSLQTNLAQEGLPPSLKAMANLEQMFQQGIQKMLISL